MKIDGEMNMENLRYEIVRLDAKLDIIINHLMNNNGSSSTTIPHTNLKTGDIDLLRQMTTKQHCTLQMVTQGKRNQDIAAVLDVTENTVKLHVRAVCKKMGVKNRQQAATIAHDIYNAIDAAEYKVLSGGIPLNWAEQLQEGKTDKYASYYVPTRKDK